MDHPWPQSIHLATLCGDLHMHHTGACEDMSDEEYLAAVTRVRAAVERWRPPCRPEVAPFDAAVYALCCAVLAEAVIHAARNITPVASAPDGPGFAVPAIEQVRKQAERLRAAIIAEYGYHLPMEFFMRASQTGATREDVTPTVSHALPRPWEEEVTDQENGLGLQVRRPIPNHVQFLQDGKVFAEWWPSKGTTRTPDGRGPICATGEDVLAWLKTM